MTVTSPVASSTSTLSTPGSAPTSPDTALTQCPQVIPLTVYDFVATACRLSLRGVRSGPDEAGDRVGRLPHLCIRLLAAGLRRVDDTGGQVLLQ